MTSVRKIDTGPQIEFRYTANMPHRGIMIGRELETTLIITGDGCGGPYLREVIIHSDEAGDNTRLCLDGRNRDRSDNDAIEWALFRLVENDFYGNERACEEATSALYPHRIAAE